jgi:MFS family permease
MHAAQRRSFWLHALIGLLPLADFLQTGTVAFSAAPVMGDIGASPEEYSLVATAYAVVAIGVICLHRWLVERFGWRTLMMSSAAAFAAGALVCGTSGSLPAFLLGRVTMALGCASFMTAGRLIVDRIPPSPRRFTGIRFYAAGIAWGLVLAPFLVGFALSQHSWRLSFLVLLVPAALLLLLAFFVLDDASVVLPDARSRVDPAGLTGLMAGSFVVLHCLQQAAFHYFESPGRLWAAIASGVAGIAIFLARNGRGSRNSLIQFNPLLTARYLVGLAMFALAYLVLGADNYMLPVLLQRAFEVPLERAASFIGIGALGGVATWIVLSRLLKGHQGPTRYYVAGFVALVIGAVRLAGLSEAANPWLSAVPALFCMGAFVILVLPTTAIQTFRNVQHDPLTFSHAIQVKNMLGQFGVAAGTALATLCLQWRSAVRYTRFGETMTSPPVQQWLDQATRHFSAHGDPALAPRMALARLSQLVSQEALFTGALDYFVILAVFACICIAGVLLQAAWKPLVAWSRD